MSLANLSPYTLNEYSDRLEWLGARGDSIGSSDGPAIMGCGYAGTSESTVWAEKVHGIQVVVPDADALKKGSIGEEFVVRMFQEDHPEFQVHTGTEGGVHRMFKSTERRYVTASLDAFYQDGDQLIPIEAKVITFEDADWRSGNVPVNYIIQLHHQMYVLGASYGWVIAQVSGKYVEKKIERNQELIDAMLEAYGEFWSSVQSQTPPATDVSQAACNTLHDLAEDVATPVSQEVADQIKERMAIDDEIKAMESKLELLKEKRAKVEVVIRRSISVKWAILPDQSAVVMNRNRWKKYTRLPKTVRVDYFL